MSTSGLYCHSDETIVHFKLYVAGNEPNSILAIINLKKLCTGALQSNYTIEIIDVFCELDVALRDKIIVTPTLIVESLPSKTKTVFFGNLNDISLLKGYLLQEHQT
jgi:circadian clock protein KaiB